MCGGRSYHGRVLRRLDLRASGDADLRRVLPRADLDVAAATGVVEPVLADVRARGYAAVREQTLRFDAVDVADPRVPADALRAASTSPAASRCTRPAW